MIHFVREGCLTVVCNKQNRFSVLSSIGHRNNNPRQIHNNGCNYFSMFTTRLKMQ